MESMENPKRGKFIVLDGVDCSGKGTQAKRLAEQLFGENKFNHSFLTREPFNTSYTREIRRILRESQNPKENARTLMELFLKDRRVHAELIEILLSYGVHVVSDRYKYSTLAYQQTQGIPLEELIEMHEGLLVPDLTLVLDVPVEVVLKRLAKDTGRAYREVFEKQDFQSELRQKFLALPAVLSKEKILIIDGDRPEREVFTDIWKEVLKIL